MGWNCETISENAPTNCAKAIADWVITPNSIWLRKYSGATTSTGMT